eukprot:EG_transcript_39073
MEGLRLCLTGFDAPAKQELERALATVPQLRLQRNFNAAVTHLIASRAGTPKYLAAVQLGVPVVTREWAVQLAQTGAPPPVELHSVKPLSGLGQDGPWPPATCSGFRQDWISSGSYSGVVVFHPSRSTSKCFFFPLSLDFHQVIRPPQGQSS